MLCPSHQWIRSWLWFLAGPSYKGHSSSFQGLLSQRQRAADPQNGNWQTGNQRGPENCPPKEALQNLLEAAMTQSQWAQAMWRR